MASGALSCSPTASAERTAEQRALRPADYRPDDVVAGEFLGDLELFVMAPSEAGDRRILVALPLDDRQEWYPAAPDLARSLEKVSGPAWCQVPGAAWLTTQGMRLVLASAPSCWPFSPTRRTPGGYWSSPASSR
jgi:hypothetical protein